MENKKAMEWPFQIIIAAVILLIIGGTMLYAVEQVRSPLGKTITKEKLKASQGACIAEAAGNQELLKNDMDNDGQPDFCDICPLFDNNIDDDHDYMPDDCDKDATNTNIFECKYGMDEREQCKAEPKPKITVPTPTEVVQENAEGKFATAKAALSSGKSDEAYQTLKELLTNYQATTVYEDAYGEFAKFEVIYANDENKLLQYYKDGVILGFGIYKYKLALFYKKIVLSNIYKNDFSKVEQILGDMTDSIKGPYDDEIYDTLADTYYTVAGGYLDAKDKTNALKYYQKVLSDFPNSKSASSAKIAYETLS